VNATKLGSDSVMLDVLDRLRFNSEFTERRRKTDTGLHISGLTTMEYKHTQAQIRTPSAHDALLWLNPLMLIALDEFRS
jgi:hypothetical protein